MVEEFLDKKYWAIILGGSRGLGLASAKKLALHGMNICIIHRDTRSDLKGIETEFQKIRETGVQLLTFNIDVLNQEKRPQVFEGISAAGGTVRCLLHSIAKGNLKPMIGGDNNILQTDDLQITIHNMAISLYEWVREIHQLGLFSKDARVLSFTSEGNKRAWKHYAAVSAAKAALEALTRNIALEYASQGIRANCIQAGVTATKSLDLIPGSNELRKNTITRNPFNRLTTPDDVADVVYLLCKDEAAWINGAVIPVDGGEQIN